MKTIIIADVHHDTDKVKKALDAGADLFVQLGDWYDDWGDTLDDFKRTTECLNEFASRDNTVLLYGNHDCEYFSGRNRIGVMGFNERKYIIDKELDPVARGRFKFHYWVGDTLISHAGYHPAVFPLEREALLDYVLMDTCNPGGNLFSIGRERGGDAIHGGPLWIDFSRIRSIKEGPRQIVGHTPGNSVRFSDRVTCIDVPEIPYFELFT